MSADKRDLRLLLTITVTTLLTWLFFLGWNTSQLIMGGDALPAWIWFKRILFYHGDWEKLLYAQELVGGATFSATSGVLPFFKFCSWLGLSAGTSMNVLVFITQICLAFLSLHCIRGLGALMGRSWTHDWSLPQKIGLIWLTGFAPIYAWRWAFGHHNIIWGSLLFVAFLSLLLAIRTAQWSLPYFFVLSFSLWHSFASDGHQLKLYSVVFGFPILLSVAIMKIPHDPQTIWQHYWRQRALVAMGVLVLAAGFLAVLPQFLTTWQFVTGGDGARALNSSSIVYDYTTANWHDWLTSLPWSAQLFGWQREPALRHEINYPFGPFFLMLLWFYFRRLWILAAATTLSFALAIALSSHFEPVSSLLLQSILPLNSFRVPARAIFPCVQFLLFAGIALITLQQNTITLYKRWFGGISLAVALALAFTLPPVWLEVIAWILVAWYMLQGMLPKTGHEPRLEQFGFFILAATSLVAFKERMPVMQSLTVMEQNARALSEALTSLTPNTPLRRVQLQFELAPFTVNSAFTAGRSSLSGYIYPTRRFLQLYSSVNHSAYQPTSVFFPVREGLPGFKVLQQMFNVTQRVTQNNQQLTATSYAATAGATWFPSQISIVPDIGTLGTTLVQQEAQLSSFLQKTLLLNADDAWAGSELMKSLDLSRCSSARAEDVKYLEDENRWLFRVQSPTDCAMILPLNYVSFWQALAQDRRLKTFVANGTLTGVVIPSGINEISLQATAVLPTPVRLSPWVALLLFGIAIMIGWYVRTQVKAAEPALQPRRIGKRPSAPGRGRRRRASETK